jgi:hypothetical protein
MLANCGLVKGLSAARKAAMRAGSTSTRFSQIDRQESGRDRNCPEAGKRRKRAAP